MKTTTLASVYRVEGLGRIYNPFSFKEPTTKATAKPGGPPGDQAQRVPGRAALLTAKRALVSSFTTTHQSIRPLQTLHWPPGAFKGNLKLCWRSPLQGQDEDCQALCCDPGVLGSACPQQVLTERRQPLRPAGSRRPWAGRRAPPSPSPPPLRPTRSPAVMTTSFRGAAFAPAVPSFPECSFPGYLYGSSLTFVRLLPTHHALSKLLPHAGI